MTDTDNNDRFVDEVDVGFGCHYNHGSKVVYHNAGPGSDKACRHGFTVDDRLIEQALHSDAFKTAQANQQKNIELYQSFRKLIDWTIEIDGDEAELPKCNNKTVERELDIPKEHLGKWNLITTPEDNVHRIVKESVRLAKYPNAPHKYA